MQQFQQFWHNKLSHLDSQLQLDYDTFIHIFAQEIKNQTSIQLTDLQREIIKKEIDPENQNQVYKSGFLLFVRNFWGVASQRTKFFNMKINLSKLKNVVEPLPMAGHIRVKVTYQARKGEQQRRFQVTDEYEIKNDKISVLSLQSESNPTDIIAIKQKPLALPGFIRIGSSPQHSDILIPQNCINQQHLKLIYSTNLQQQGKSTASFIVEPKPVTRVFVRDVSVSNRTSYVIDNDCNYFVVKSGMIVTEVGLVDGMFQIVIDTVPHVEAGEIGAMLQNMNADRKSYMIGEPDKPIKVATNWDFQPVNQSLIADLYDRGLFYPQTKIKPTKVQTKDEKTRLPLKIRVINKRTLQQYKFESKNLKYLAVGRDQQKCAVHIDHISIRPIEFTFECINQIWFIRMSPQKSVQNMQNPSVNLSKDRNRCSNRLPLCAEYPHTFRVRNRVTINISIVDRQKNQQEDY